MLRAGKILELATPEGFIASPKEEVQAFLESNSTQYADMAQTIWGLAELGYMEEQSAALLQGSLTAAGFEVETGVFDIQSSDPRALQWTVW